MTKIAPSQQVIAYLSKSRDLTHSFLTEALAAKGLSGLVPSHGEILLALHLNDGMSMQKISSWVGRSKPTVTVLIDKLTMLGYVNKNRSKNDGRIFEVSLTAKGHKLIDELSIISKQLHKRIDKAITAIEKAELARILNKLITHW